MKMRQGFVSNSSSCSFYIPVDPSQVRYLDGEECEVTLTIKVPKDSILQTEEDYFTNIGDDISDNDLSDEHWFYTLQQLWKKGKIMVHWGSMEGNQTCIAMSEILGEENIVFDFQGE